MIDEHARDGDDAVRRALADVPEQKWRALRRVVEELSAADLSTEWVRPEPRTVVRDGVEQKIHHFPYPRYAQPVITAEAALYDMGLIVDFDWPSWSESQRYFDGEPVEDPVVAVKFLTAVVRAERFNEGVLDRAVESGVFAGALRVLCGGSGRRSITRSGRFRGCLLGGAVGDALGAPVEFETLSTILDRYGPDGITDYSPAFGRLGAITDDTQMTLFTAEGLLVARDRPGSDPVVEINRAYLRWLATQTDGSDPEPGVDDDGWLLGEGFLHSRRAPGNTCLSALQRGGMGTTGRPMNDSKGCGGVMRVAPIGLVAEDPFRLAADAAALTHGHPSGYLAAGALADLIGELAAGQLPARRRRPRPGSHRDRARQRRGGRRDRRGRRPCGPRSGRDRHGRGAGRGMGGRGSAGHVRLLRSGGRRLRERRRAGRQPRRRQRQHRRHHRQHPRHAAG